VPFAVLAEALLKAGDHGEALAAVQKARELNPKDARVAELMGDIQKAMGKRDAATTSYATAAHLQPNSIALQVKLAENFAANGSLREANNILRRTLEAFPQSVAAKAGLAENLVLSKNFAEALDLAKQIQKQAPKQAVGYLLEGEIGMAQRDYVRAAGALETADALRPNGLARVRLHQARKAAGKPASDANLREWVNNNPQDQSTRFYLAEIENKAGNRKAAIEHYRMILTQNSRHVGALNNLALALHKEGDPKAVEYAVQAFQMRPGDPRLADTAGWLLVSQGKLLEGLPVLTKAVSLAGNNPEIRFHLALALVKAGDTVRARSELKTALASGTTFSQIEEARELMRKLGP
jgi:putative PEP-CTERM system TPR-repeat lipoprotein